MVEDPRWLMTEPPLMRGAFTLALVSGVAERQPGGFGMSAAPLSRPFQRPVPKGVGPGRGSRPAKQRLAVPVTAPAAKRPLQRGQVSAYHPLPMEMYVLRLMRYGI